MGKPGNQESPERNYTMRATTSSSKSITVSIVSHGQQELIVPLLEQLETYCADVIAKVVLTVNIPEHEQLTHRAWHFPLERTENAQPRGFGANHNAAFKHCTSPWFLVLNPDIRFDSDALTALLTLRGDTDGVRAPRIVEPGKTAVEPHRGLLTPWEILQRNRAGYTPPTQPAWIPGMFMLFRTDAYREIGGFDQGFFMYGEDFDICARLQLAGWTIGVAETIRVQHGAQRASHRSWRHLCWHFNSLAKVWLSRTFWRYARLYGARLTVKPTAFPAFGNQATQGPSSSDDADPDPASQQCSRPQPPECKIGQTAPPSHRDCNIV